MVLLCNMLKIFLSLYKEVVLGFAVSHAQEFFIFI